MKRFDELGVSPAPWGAAYVYNKPAVYDRDDRWVADCDVRFDQRRDDANATFIAASPGLYEALRLVLETIDALGFKPVVESDPLALAVKCGEKALEKAGGGE